MQNAGLAALELNWRYLAFEVRPEDLAAALEGAKRMGFIGLNLTLPHKLLAVGMIEVLDESARTWGAVNTIRFEGRNAGGDWRPMQEFNALPAEARAHGFNTDADAITAALREDLGYEARDISILILGAGGAGRTVALKLAAEKPRELFLVNRTKSKAEAIAREINQRYPRLEVQTGYPKDGAELLVNATSLGLRPEDPLPYDEQQLPLDRVGAVFDLIYRPAETELLRVARAAGCRVANGLGMLLHQGTKALEIWTGRRAPVEIMREALQASLYG